MYSEIYAKALTTVEWPDESYIPALRCPITGMVVSEGFGPDQDRHRDAPLQPVDEKCPTLMFRYMPELGIDYIHPDLQARIDSKRAELEKTEADIDLIDDFEIITDHLEDLGEAPMIIDMPTAGLIGDRIVIGLDLARAIPGD